MSRLLTTIRTDKWAITVTFVILGYMSLWYIFGALFSALFGFAYFTNPFSRWTIVRRHYRAHLNNRVLEVIDESRKLKVSNSPLMKALAVMNNGIYILFSRWHRRATSRATTVEGIIDDIYRLRFDPNKLLLTSGDHFSSLFVRNLGVFYYPTLDTQLSTTEDKWQRRQICYLQTLTYALGVFDQCDTLTTTIVPTGRMRATCVNFHAYPSDTLYGMLFALAALLDKQPGHAFDYSNATTPLDTVEAAQTLLNTYRSSLMRHYQTYRDTVFDERTNLIRRGVVMSGAKDITKRDSAFFDNVVFWKTTELAMRLDLIPQNQTFLAKLKRTIVDTFWLEDAGYFLEDLSEEGMANQYYSSDWLIVLVTGFLSPANKKEQAYFARSVAYIQDSGIDMPFAIKYQADTRAHRQFPIVRLAVASYGGDSIWSFWGMEYIKVLLALYRETADSAYLDAADYHIAQYKQKMLEYGGYPEVYDADGRLLETPFYRSIIETGWVVGFEQVLAMRTATR